MIIAALIQVFLPFFLEWLEKRFKKVAPKLKKPEDYASPEEGVDDLFSKTLEETHGVIRRLQVRWAWRQARKNAAAVMAGKPFTIDQDEAEEGQMLNAVKSDRRQDVIDKIKEHVYSRFSADYKAAFKSYDRDQDGNINREELTAFLYDAEIGSRLTRSTYVRRIIEELDQDQDGLVSYTEFEEYAT
jgi:Ca2+-binding EF-hand superfamily protein